MGGVVDEGYEIVLTTFSGEYIATVHLDDEMVSALIRLGMRRLMEELVNDRLD